MGLVIEQYLDVHEIVLCPSIRPRSDVGNDREMWRTSSFVGSSYMYEWYHPIRKYRLETEEERAQFEWTSRLSNEPTNAIAMDSNFEFWSYYRGPVFCHTLLRTANILFADASVGTFSYDEGLVVKKNDKNYPMKLVWDVAHQLRTRD